MENGFQGKCSCCGKKTFSVCSDCLTDSGTQTLNFHTLRLCPDCDKVFEGPSNKCPSCAGTSWLSVPAYFGGKQNKILEVGRSYLCVPCGIVFEGTSEAKCPVCSSQLLVSLGELQGKVNNNGRTYNHDSGKVVGAVSQFRSRDKSSSESRSYRKTW